MTIDFTYPRYLAAKRSVDDRALNRGVLHSLQEALSRRPAESLRVLEIGGGTGTMVKRLVDWRILTTAHYTLVDSDSESLAVLPREAGADIEMRAVEDDICVFLSNTAEQFDLVIAHAVLDLIDLGELLPLLWSRCAPGAHFWFTINFDGESVFLPALEGDQEIWDAYHASMNRRPGSSHAGRNLFAQLASSGAHIDSAGSSDWVVHALSGAYPEQEGYFLHYIIHTIDEELRGHAPIENFAEWIAKRHAQVEAATLVYMTHQLDFFGRAP